MKKLHYIFHGKDWTEKTMRFYLNKERSEFVVNFEVLNNLVGTLTKRDGSGRFVPYLVKGWSVSEDKRRWQFQLKPNLTFDNGDPITAEGFTQHLTQQLLKYNKLHGGSLFEQLEGWDSFVNEDSSSITGLFSKNEIIYFHFNSIPSEFLEKLSILYFGYWHSENAKLVKEGKFISSAAYSVSLFDKPHEITLVKRKDWPIENKKAPQEVVFMGFNVNKREIPTKRTIVHIGSHDVEIENREKYHTITSTPSILTTFVLSPYKKGPFKDVKLRRAFAENLQKEMKLNPIETHSISSTESFYFNSDPLVFKGDNQDFDLKGQSILVNDSMGFHLPKTKVLKDILEKVSKSFNLKVLYEKIDKMDAEWYKKTRSQRYYDLALLSYSTGPTYLHVAVKLMFCTNLDVVSYPDPSGRICQLVKEQDKKKNSSTVDEEYKKRFNQYLVENATVIPIFHRRTLVLHSKDLNVMPHMVDIVLPPLERIEVH